MTSKAIVRSAEDIDEKALSYAEVKALAVGNPLIMKKIQLDTEVSKLILLKQSYLNEIYSLEDRIAKHYPVEIKRLKDKITNIEKDIQCIKQNTNINNKEEFSTMVLQGKQYITREDAGKAILEICKNKDKSIPEEIGEYRGLKMLLEIEGLSRDFVLYLQGKYSYQVNLGTDINGNITRIDNVICNFSKELDDAKVKLEETQKQFENAKEAVKAPFYKEDELKQKSKELDKINAELNLDKNENEIIDDDENKDLDKQNVKNQEMDKDDLR